MNAASSSLPGNVERLNRQRGETNDAKRTQKTNIFLNQSGWDGRKGCTYWNTARIAGDKRRVNCSREPVRIKPVDNLWRIDVRDGVASPLFIAARWITLREWDLAREKEGFSRWFPRFRSEGKKEEGGGRMKWEWRGQVRGVTILLGITIIGMIIV